jgi:hypothetical protein
VDSEVGGLRAVIVHRPGAELKRVLPRHAGRLLFAGLPTAALGSVLAGAASGRLTHRTLRMRSA